VRELKEYFNPTVDDGEPEEPEFDLLTESPKREARKSAKILDAISQLKSNEHQRQFLKIDPLDEILNSSKGSLGSLAKVSSEHDCKHDGEGSLTDIFGGETPAVEEPTKDASGHDSDTEDSSEVEEEEEELLDLSKLSKEERRRRAKQLWQSERSMNASFVQSSPNASFVQSSPHASFTTVSRVA
jgi:hypothetical protein